MRLCLFLALATAPLIGCGAPRAAPLGGDVADALERGIAGGNASFDHALWDGLLQRFVKDGGRRFDYQGLKGEESTFETYLSSLAAVDLKTLSETELQALLINAYNAYTVKTILDHVRTDGSYAIESIRDVPDVFGREVHSVGGFVLSLDNIEHNLLRPMFRDARFHFAVNCASESCPPLPGRAFTGSRLDEQLETATRAALTDVDYVAVANDALMVTRIMDWYGGDFIDPEYKHSEATLAEFIARYANEDVVSFIARQGDAIRVEFREYLWGLNKS